MTFLLFEVILAISFTRKAQKLTKPISIQRDGFFIQNQLACIVAL